MNIYRKIYRELYRYFGPQKWWPGDTPDEIIIGAVLTQNTAWGNVEKAIHNLKSHDIITLESIGQCNEDMLKEAIRPAGFFNQKSAYLKNIAEFMKPYNYNCNNLKSLDTDSLRNALLEVKGIGRETADSILLYALDKPVFVVDAYTKRLFKRHIENFPEKYEHIRALFESNLESDAGLFNEYHALIVRAGKEFCRKKPLCGQCPLRTGK